MPLGITSASDVFQRAIEELFTGYLCAIIVDDLLLWGEGTADHDVNVKKVLERAREVGIKLAPKSFALTKYPMFAISSQMAVETQ